MTFTDNDTYFTVNTGTDANMNFPKNSVALYRNGDEFRVINGGDRKELMFREFQWDDVTTPSAATADLMEAAINAIIFA